MNNQQLIEISNSQNDSEKIKAILRYLQEVTSVLTHFKEEIDILKSMVKESQEDIRNNATSLGHLNEMLEIHSKTLNSISDHLSTHDSYLETHDRHLENLGQHLESHTGHLAVHDQQLQVLRERL